MLRRAGRFHRLKQTSSTPLDPEDTGETLHRKWLEWAERESLKRLVFHSFLLDAQISMTMLTNPIISYAELAIPFPESQDLWMAEDAEQWKTLYLGRPGPPPPPPQLQHPSLAHFLREPIEVPEYYDQHFARQIILHGLWGMIWQHSQLCSAFGKVGHSQAALALRYQDILQAIRNFRVNLSAGHVSPCPETSLVLELLPMYLHSSLEEIQLFAGKEGLDDARRVLPSLQRWVDGRDSRQAIWHAGQVLRAARGFRPRQLRGSFTIAVYHASLTIWTYSVIVQAKDAAQDGGQKSTNATRVVYLDGPDTPPIQQFITMGKAIPSIARIHGTGTSATTTVPLSDQNAVMSVFMETLESNFPCYHEEQAPPPLVENLIQLLRDLGKAAGTIGG